MPPGNTHTDLFHGAVPATAVNVHQTTTGRLNVPRFSSKCSAKQTLFVPPLKKTTGPQSSPSCSQR